jgi:hypothetical protein
MRDYDDRPLENEPKYKPKEKLYSSSRNFEDSGKKRFANSRKQEKYEKPEKQPLYVAKSEYVEKRPAPSSEPRPK